MCMPSPDAISLCAASLASAFRHRRPSKRHNLRIHRLNRRRNSSMKERKQRKGKKKMLRAEVEFKNMMRLYRVNQSIMEENEKLRKKALLLHEENQALFSELQKKLPFSSNHLHHNHNPF